MMKKALTLVLAGVIALSLAACKGGASASAAAAPAPAAGGEAKDDEAKAPEKDVRATTLKLAFNQSERHPRYLALSEMSGVFYEATNGAYRVEISPSELLGLQKDMFKLVQSGTIQVVMVASSIVENVDPDLAMLGLPCTYDSVEYQEKVLIDGALDDIFASTEASNFGVMTAFIAGACYIYTDKPIQTPADLRGYKIRAMESQIYIAILDVMGGVGTPMAQGEVYTAIQWDVINDGESNEITYADLKHYEVTPYFSYTRHLVIPGLLAVNTAILRGVGEEGRQTLKDLCKEHTERELQLWDENLGGAKNTAEGAGAQSIDVGIAPFQGACQPVTDNMTSKSEETKALYEEIRSLAD